MSERTLSARRVIVIDDQAETHADFRKILCPPEATTTLQLAKARRFGAPEAAAAPVPVRFSVDSALQGEDGARAVARAMVESDPYHVAFVGMRMPPGWDGLQTIQALWQADPNLQVVLCTAYSDEALESVTHTLGHAHKLLVLKRPFEPIEVQQLATALCEKWRAEREAELKVEELERRVSERTREAERAALHDKLTDLPNRTLMMDRLDRCLEHSHRDVTRRFALLFLDVDGFKGVNDALGHSVGDQLLVRIAERIRSALRGRDVVAPASTPARFGGDEFLVLIDGLSHSFDAARIAERLVAELSEPYEVTGHRITVSVSIGVATADRPYASASDMLRDANIAMYRAKQRGRARYVLFDEELNREAAARLKLEAALRKAVREDALSLHYQPIVRVADGAIEGFEALVRWRDPELGDVPASDLIIAAEETGVIQELGIQLLRRACKQLATWQSSIPSARQIRMMVNLSRRQLVDSEFSSRVADVVRESGVDATKLGLEITETSVLHDIDGAIAVLRRMRSLGASVLLDDFGSGYSAISYLDRMPLTGLKIERSFITRAQHDVRHAAMLEAMVRMARAFTLDIVAEGVETRAELALVQGLGIELAQGWLWARAVPAHEAEAMIRAGKLEPSA